MIYKKKERKSLMITVTKEIFTYLYTCRLHRCHYVGATMMEIIVAERPDSLHKDMNKRALLKSTLITTV